MRNVDRLRIQGFKSIEDVELELGPLNVVVGANGAGKSNLIGAFRFLERLVTKNLQLTVGQAGGAERFLFHGSKRTTNLRLYFRFGENAYEANLVPATDSLIFASEVGHYYGYPALRGIPVDDYAVPFATGSRESQLIEEAEKPEGKIARYVRDAVVDWSVFHFHDTSDSSPAKQKGDLDDNRRLRKDAGNLAAFLYALKRTHQARYSQIVAQIRLAAPFFDDFILEPDRLNERKIKLEWRQRGSDAYFDAHSLSDGTLRFICLATLLLQPVPPSVVLIDEPELGLHPFAIQLLADLLKSASKRAQLLVATQSVTLLNQLDPEDLLITEHDGVRTTIERLSMRLPPERLAAWLDDYSIGELWEKNVIGGRPR
jgi:predicted ATPase